MRAAVWLFIARCAVARAPVVLDGRAARCGAESIALPASMTIVRHDARVIEAHDEHAAVIVARTGSAAADRAWEVGEGPDFFAARVANGCAFAVVTETPQSAEGIGLVEQVGGVRAEVWLLGGAADQKRVPYPPLERLERACGETCFP